MKKTLIATVAIAVAPLLTAVPAQADPRCAPGHVVDVPMSNGNLPVKCVPQGNIPPGYVDGTGGNAPLETRYGLTGAPVGYHTTIGTAGYKTDPAYPHNPGGPPCSSSQGRVIKVDPQTGNAIEDWGPPGCDLGKPMTN